MSLRFAVIHEARADFQTGTELADRVLVESIKWLDDEAIVHYRHWLDTTDNGENLTWKNVRRLAREAGIRAHGHFNGEPGLPDATAARRAILLLLRVVPDLRAIVLIRDQDDEPDRRAGLEQARSQNHSGIPIVVGLAIVERECWVLSGFEPQDEDEITRLEAERKTLGFDPRLKSHELTACKNDQAPRSPKRVLRMLSGGNYDRERQCWDKSALQRLRDRGEHNVLVEYLKEVGDKLAPLIGSIE